MGKVIRKIAKPIAKIIPKEIRPALPFIVPFIPGIGPALAGGLQSLGVSAKLAPLLARGLISSTTTALSDPNAKTSDIFRSGIISVAPQAISQGLGSLEQAGKLPEFLTKVGEGKDAVSALEKIQSSLQPDTLLGKAGMVATQTGVQQAPIMKRLNEEALRDYEAQLREQGIMDSAERRNAIFGYFSRAGYADDEINSMLDKYGYAYGGRVGYNKAGLVTLEDLINKTPSGEVFMSQFKTKDDLYDEDEEEGGAIDVASLLGEETKPRSKFSSKDFMTGLDYATKGLETAFGRPIDMKPQPTRFGLADGGLMNLREGGMPAEMDMRGGGFVPIGKQRRADDVPARLSKDEFVLTARAVDGVGKATTGNAKDGAKIMYDFMNKYEALA